jgi:hypothetical protein
MAKLGELMKSVGVQNHPDWFHSVELLHWPMPHQLDVLKKYAGNMRYGDWGEPGVGKTFPAQVHAVLMASLGNKTVFVMPPKLIDQFHEELKDYFSGIEKHLHIDHLDVPADKKAKLMSKWDLIGWPDILLLSYDVYRMLNDKSPKKKIGANLWFMEDGSSFYDADGVVKDKRAQPFTKDGREINTRGMARNNHQFRLKKAGYNVLFFDEAHALCGVDSILSESVHEMASAGSDDVAVYLMTGTPVPTHLHDVYGLLRLVNPEAYGNKASFIRQHCITQPFTINNGKREITVQQIVGYKDTDKVFEALYKNATRTQKRDVIPLPEPMISQIRVRLAGAHKRLYTKIIRDQFAVLGETVLAPDNQSALRHLALQLISCPEQFDDTGKITADNEVAKAADDVLEMVNLAENKIIIFAFYKKTIEFLAERYAQWNPAVVYGESTSSKEDIERFKTDPNCRVAVVNWVSGGAGLNLQVAHHILFYECPTSPKHAKQAIARCDRTGQAHIVNVYFLRVMQTLSDKNFKNLLKNEESNNQAVRDKRDLLHELLG